MLGAPVAGAGALRVGIWACAALGCMLRVAGRIGPRKNAQLTSLSEENLVLLVGHRKGA